MNEIVKKKIHIILDENWDIKKFKENYDTIGLTQELLQTHLTAKLMLDLTNYFSHLNAP